MYQNKIPSQEIYDFFQKLKRDFFIDNKYKQFAHFDQALPIGFDQTISQPSLVLEMTLELDLNKKCKVLEIGTGSGYQTVFLAEFANEVFTVERIEELSIKAQKRLNKLGYKNIKFKISDGSEGWKEFSPYDRIIVTAGASKVPEDLLKQLKPNAKMVIPIGEQGFQELLLIEKDKNNNAKRESLGIVRFVELKGKYGWN